VPRACVQRKAGTRIQALIQAVSASKSPTASPPSPPSRASRAAERAQRVGSTTTVRQDAVQGERRRLGGLYREIADEAPLNKPCYKVVKDVKGRFEQGPEHRHRIGT
jgi:hypothetical protein